MSRVARSARVGSRQRTENISANKTLTAAESGETYFLSGSRDTALANGAGEGPLTVTLPSPEEGSYYKFVVGNGHTCSISVAAQDGDYFTGFVTQLSGTCVRLVAPDGNSNDVLTIHTGSTAGSWVSFTSDGTTWNLDGVLSGSGGPNIGSWHSAAGGIVFSDD